MADWKGLTVYWIDRDDRIVRVNEQWDRFAESNEGHGCTSAAVLGRSLWPFITGDSTRMLIATCMDRVRVHDRPVLRPYRCDSPELARHMEMSITMEDEGLLRVEHRLVEAQPKPLERRTVVLTPSRVCSTCLRLEREGRWEDGERPEPGTIFAVCPDCASKWAPRTSV